MPKARRLVEYESQIRRELAKFQKINKSAVLAEKNKMKERVAQFARGTIEENELENKRMAIRTKFVNQMRSLFEGSIIRRTAKSVDNKGERINHLEDREEVNYYIDMTPEEQVSFQQVIDKSRGAA